jgi:hypothetical protein
MNLNPYNENSYCGGEKMRNYILHKESILLFWFHNFVILLLSKKQTSLYILDLL